MGKTCPHTHTGSLSLSPTHTLAYRETQRDSERERERERNTHAYTEQEKLRFLLFEVDRGVGSSRGRAEGGAVGSIKGKRKCVGRGVGGAGTKGGS